MARIRTIKPDFFTSLTICSMPLRARLTFVGLWTHVDDAGRCVDDVRLIRAAIWPLDDWTLADIDDDLKEIAGKGLVVRYELQDRHYLAIRGFGEHQRINKPTPSKLPAAPGPEHSHETPPLLREDSSTPTGGLLHDSPPERNGKEGNLERRNPSRASVRDSPPEFPISQADESQIPYRLRTPKVWCDEHGSPDDRECVGCKVQYGNVAYHAKRRAGRSGK